MLEAVEKSVGVAPQRSGSTSKPGRGPPSPNWAVQKASTKLALNGPMSKNMSVVPLEGKKDSDGTNCGQGGPVSMLLLDGRATHAQRRRREIPGAKAVQLDDTSLTGR